MECLSGRFHIYDGGSACGAVATPMRDLLTRPDISHIPLAVTDESGIVPGLYSIDAICNAHGVLQHYFIWHAS